MDPVNWTQMAHGTREDYAQLDELYRQHTQSHLVANVIHLLELMRGPKLGYQIDRYEHSLQSASRAQRAGERVDLVVGCLLHDIADSFAPQNHSATAAEMLRPYVDDEAYWVVKHHGLFQGYYYFHHLDGDRHARDAHIDSPHYEACVRFCHEYDQNCFDPDYPNLPLESFVPLLNQVFARPSRVPGIALAGTAAATQIN